MKSVNKLNRSLLIPVLLTSLILMAFSYAGKKSVSSISYAAGAPAGYSGDPANGNLNCTNCHSGNAVVTETDWITSDVPQSGYIPGTTYTIDATASGEGISKFGFQVSPQNSTGTVLGTLISSGAETQLISGASYITQTSSGNTGTDSKTWTFEWTAPEVGSGAVVFYGAFNLTNNNGYSSGDNIVLSTLTLSEDPASYLNLWNGEKHLNVYPNPAQDHIIIVSAERFFDADYFILDLAGKQVMSGSIKNQKTNVDVNQLSPGTYLVRIAGAKGPSMKFIKE